MQKCIEAHRTFWKFSYWNYCGRDVIGSTQQKLMNEESSLVLMFIHACLQTGARVLQYLYYECTIQGNLCTLQYFLFLYGIKKQQKKSVWEVCLKKLYNIGYYIYSLYIYYKINIVLYKKIVKQKKNVNFLSPGICIVNLNIVYNYHIIYF